MGQQDGIKISPELLDAMQKSAEHLAKSGASINEVMNAADTIRQAFLDSYSKEAMKQLKSVKP